MAIPVRARIIVAQAGFTPPSGYQAGSVDGLALGQLVTCANQSDAGVIAWSWEVFPAVGQTLGAYGVAGADSPTLSLTPPGTTGYGDVAVRLTVYGEPLPGGRPNVAVDEVLLGVRAPNAVYMPGVPIPHPHESQVGGRIVLDPTSGAQGRLAEVAIALAKGAGGGAAQTPAEWVFTLSGVYDAAVLGGYVDPPRRAPSARTISRVELFRRTAGASGVTACDVKKNGVSIFSGAGLPLQVTAAAGDYAVQSVTTFASAAVAQNDRLEVTLESAEAFLAGPPEGPEGITVTVFFA